jgi:sugar phosphate isomerase/epimerase
MAKTGIQLFTVRDFLEKDYLGTIRAMKEIGYEGVEFPCGTMKDISASELKGKLEEFGLLLAGIMFEFKEFASDTDGIIKYCLTSGCETVIIPSLYQDFEQYKENYIAFANSLNKLGKRLKYHGINLLYHIHGNEFEPFGDFTGFDIFASHLQTDSVKLEIDTYWVAWAKQDPVEFFGRYGKISPHIHFKDCIDLKDMEDTEVGTGCIDMNSIAQIGVKNKAEWFIVEQEQYRGTSIDSAKTSYLNLKEIKDSAENMAYEGET